VLDLAMPGMGGLQALPGIRAAAPRASVVLLTAADRADISAAELDQTLGMLDKTIDLDALVRSLAGLVVSTPAA
jgi:DNA-binding NarL/FixJ family response regulator